MGRKGKVFKEGSRTGTKALRPSQAEPQRTTDLYENPFDTLPVGCFTFDENGLILEANGAAERILCVKKQELINTLFSRFLCPEDDAAYLSHLRRVIETQSKQSCELRLAAQDGSSAYLRFETAAVTDEAGHLNRCRTVIIDITDRKIREEERDLSQKQTLQARKMEFIATLAGGIAHDFNNLLQAVVGYSDMLLYRKKPDDADYKRLQAIRQAGRDARDVVKRMLAFSQRLEPNRQPLDLNSEAERIAQSLNRTLPKMIRVKLIPGENLGIVNADPSQMEQALLNLAVYAKHAMPNGGRLTIETANVTLDDEECRMAPTLKPGAYVLLKLSDTSRGMEDAVLERIFEPFFSVKKQGEGTGLGLAMVYGIVKSHQGHVTCESEPGKGTVFKIYLPAVPQHPEIDCADAALTPVSGSETLLVVEDEDVMRNIAKQILTMAGYTVLTACDGKKAVELYRSEKDRIALVLLDWVMPEMGGEQCLEELVKMDGEVKVIIASGVLTERPCSAAESRVKGFVPKPYDVQELLKLVRKALDES